MNHRQQSLLWISLFILFRHDAVAFTAPLAAHRRGVSKPSGHQLSAHQASTPLHYRDRHASEEHMTDPISSSRPQSPSDDALSDPYRSGISMSLIRAIWFNQASILLFATTMIAGMTLVSDGSVDFSSLHWNGSPTFHSFYDWDLTSLRVLEGFLATLPMIALGSTIEKSDKRDASNVNFSTTNMVISLFGRRKSSTDPEATSSSLVMLLSAAIALSTGISEEMVFRGYVPMAIGSLTQSIPLALTGQAALFAFAHISPKSTSGENKVVGGLQFLNGLWYGLVYLMTGGDILPCMIAHMLFDMHVLCETWMVVNKQMDYTQVAFQQQLGESEEQAIRQIKQQAGPSLNSETLNFARRFFYAFDYDHKGSLSLSDVQRAVSYAFLKDKVIPEPKKVEEVFGKVIDTRDPSAPTPAGRLSVSEFLRVLFALKSRGAIA
jgi:membrane protease YdiL (CAAX protease family)